MSIFIPALSIQQPWTWLIVHRFKNIENRSRRCHYRGPVLLHAGLKVDEHADVRLTNGFHPVTRDVLPGASSIYRAHGEAGTIYRGGIVGIADIIGCVEHSEDPYFVGPFGWVIENARPLRFQPCRGMLGLFDPKINVDLSVVA